MQGDVSFTFLDRIEEVELNIVDRRWQSALALALTLPDICGVHLQMQTDQVFRSADEIDKICDEIWDHTNTIQLSSSLSEEESKFITMKEKQKEIIRTTEEILNIIYKYKGNV